MEIPSYIIASTISHMEQLMRRIPADPADTRTVNLLRLARKDITKLQKYVKTGKPGQSTA